MNKSVSDTDQNCLVCGQFCNKRRGLGNHVNRAHKELGGLMGYVLKHQLNSEHPKCLCGCGENVTWHKLLYKFNDYVTGHNDAGFRVKQPTFTKEQVEKRNDAIKKAYDNNTDLRERISKSVKESLNTSSFDFSAHHKKAWNDSEQIKKRSESQKRSWSGEEGIVRRKNVFTKEFGEKISHANMNRDQKKTSESEARIIQSLSSVFSIETCKWFNFSKKTWCADVWLKDHSTIVEIDGAYWHGLDRTECYTHQQLTSITNDLIKNKIAIDKKLSLIRVRDDIDFSNVRTIDDLIELSYHYVREGEVIKEGTFKVGDADVILSRDVLLKSDNEKKEQLVQLLKSLLTEYVSYHGWFYPCSNHSIVDAMSAVRLSESANDTSRIANTWLKANVRSYWDVDDGPRQATSDVDKLERVVRYRVGLNNSKQYTYSVDGQDVSSNETFNISLATIRKGLIVQRNSVSWFNVSAAAYIYKTLLQDVENPVVWDPSIGFSARMFAFASLFNEGKYVGTDPATQMFDDACRLKSELNHTCLTQIDLHNVGSETFKPNEKFDLVFTSPPYFDTETYFEQQGQCYIDYPTFESWRRSYLQPTLQTAYDSLKHERCCVLNVSDKYADVIVETAKQVGFSYDETLLENIKLNNDHFMRKQGFVLKRTEQFYVLKKR